MKILVTGISGRIGANLAKASSMKDMKYADWFGKRIRGWKSLKGFRLNWLREV